MHHFECFVYQLSRVSGSLHLCKQEHTPFDVVAWHGKYVEIFFFYKLSIDIIVAMFLINIIWRNSSTLDLFLRQVESPFKPSSCRRTILILLQDHIDPSIFCVLTVRSKTPGTPLADFLIFSPRWDVASETYRPPVRFIP